MLEPPAIVPTLKVYAERWLDGVAALRCQPSTVELYRHRLTTRLLPALGPLPLTAITRERIKALVADQFRSGSLKIEGRLISPKTLRAVMSTLITILNSAAIRAILAALAVSRELADRVPPFAASLDTSHAAAISA